MICETLCVHGSYYLSFFIFDLKVEVVTFAALQIYQNPIFPHHLHVVDLAPVRMAFASYRNVDELGPPPRNMESHNAAFHVEGQCIFKNIEINN